MTVFQLGMQRSAKTMIYIKIRPVTVCQLTLGPAQPGGASIKKALDRSKALPAAEGADAYSLPLSDKPTRRGVMR